MKTFTDCIKKGGKVRTRKLSNNRYQIICILKGRVCPGKIYKKKERNNETEIR